MGDVLRPGVSFSHHLHDVICSPILMVFVALSQHSPFFKEVILLHLLFRNRYESAFIGIGIGIGIGEFVDIGESVGIGEDIGESVDFSFAFVIISQYLSS